MKCHYEVLNIDESASDDDIKKSYRKLALKWHPDKNIENAEEAKEQFQLIQQAYEVLSDPQERAWYDRHKDSILKGGFKNYEDNSLNVYQYFTSTCYKGFGDDEKGFYKVYDEVFKTIAAEDSEFDKDLDSDFEVPCFGTSTSSYHDVVYPFYVYWQTYSTKKTYAWLDSFDIQQAPNRRVLRLMEKENKKIRDKAKKERNEEVRALVSFVRKRDKRVQEHIRKLEQLALENEKKAEERRREQIKKRQEERKSYVECDWAKFSNFEKELQEIEANVAEEFKDSGSEECSEGDEDAEDEEEIPSNLYCSACNKMFKTEGAFINHENSKKHQEALALLENAEDASEDDEEEMDNSVTEQEGASVDTKAILTDEDLLLSDENIPQSNRKKKKKSTKLHQPPDVHGDSGSEELGVDFLEESRKKSRRARLLSEQEVTVEKKKPSKKNKAKGKNKDSQQAETEISDVKDAPKVLCDESLPSPPSAVEEEKSSKKEKVNVSKSSTKTSDLTKACAKCKSVFKSKNELFKHLKSTGHSVFIGSENAPVREIEVGKNTSRKKKGNRQ